MKTWEAIKALQEGKRVRHEEWPSGWIQQTPSGRIADESGEEFRFSWLDDRGWELYEEPGHDFAWAIKQIKAGKKVRRKAWGFRYYYYHSQAGRVVGSDGLLVPVDIIEFEAKDWVLA